MNCQTLTRRSCRTRQAQARGQRDEGQEPHVAPKSRVRATSEGGVRELCEGPARMQVPRGSEATPLVPKRAGFLDSPHLVTAHPVGPHPLRRAERGLRGRSTQPCERPSRLGAPKRRTAVVGAPSWRKGAERSRGRGRGPAQGGRRRDCGLRGPLGVDCGRAADPANYYWGGGATISRGRPPHSPRRRRPEQNSGRRERVRVTLKDLGTSPHASLKGLEVPLRRPPAA